MSRRVGRRRSLPIRAAIGALAAMIAGSFSIASADAQVMLGAFTGSGANGQQALLTLEQEIGRKLAIDFHYIGLTKTQLRRDAWDIANGRMPVIALAVQNGTGCYTAADIASGKYDTGLKAQGAAVAALGATVMISFVSEMTNATPAMNCFYGAGWDNNDASIVAAGAAYAAAQQHVVTLFRNAGATNAKFVFAPEGTAYAALIDNVAEWTLFYPGPDTVDVLAMDHHYTGRTQEDFASDGKMLALYNACIDQAKPCMLAETGAQPAEEYIQTAESAIPLLFPDVIAFVWNNNTYPLSGNSLAAFTAMGQDPYFQQMP